eukprot:1032960-Amphidinium_carterae.1
MTARPLGDAVMQSCNFGLHDRVPQESHSHAVMQPATVYSVEVSTMDFSFSQLETRSYKRLNLAVDDD